MAKKFTVKTIREYTYDKEGRIVKEVVTEESYEEEITGKHSGGYISGGTIRADKTNPDSFKKSIGIPYGSYDVTGTCTIDCGTTSSISNAKSDTSGIIHNIDINDINDKETIDNLVNGIKNALNNIEIRTHKLT